MRDPNRFRRIAVGMAAGLLTCGLGLLSGPVFAASSSNVSSATNVSSGSLSVSGPTLIMGWSALTLSHTNDTSPLVTGGTLGQLVVNDATGTGDGWTVTVQATPATEETPSGGFASGTQAIVLPAGTVLWDGFQTVSADSGQPASEDPTLPSGSGQGSWWAPLDSGTPVTTATAPSGTGEGQWSFLQPATTPNLQFSMQPYLRVVDPVNYPTAATPYSTVLTFTVTQG